MNKLQEIIVIIHRFSGSHDHHIRNPLTTYLLNLIDLSKHLRRRKISHQTSDRWCTECTSHPATDLGGNTDRISMLIFHKNTFDYISIIKTEQELVRTVNLGNLSLQHNNRENLIILFQFFPQSLWKIRHLIKMIYQLHMQPFINLFCTKCFFSDCRHLFL